MVGSPPCSARSVSHTVLSTSTPKQRLLSTRYGRLARVLRLPSRRESAAGGLQNGLEAACQITPGMRSRSAVVEVVAPDLIALQLIVPSLSCVNPRNLTEVPSTIA